MNTANRPMQNIIAPFSGKIVDLSKVPDPVFSEKLTGDGIAILATGTEVLAPCDGRITLFFETKHAFAITTDTGVQILVHLGLDTVILNGEGITALHKTGDIVKAGTPILQFDLAFLQKKKINLISPVLIVNYETVHDMHSNSVGTCVEAGCDTVLQYAI
jgi:sugar PTS system EIIA component